MNTIYHITTRQSLELARQTGAYRADSLSSQGFIHFSQAHQVFGVANSFYAGQADLVILVVDPARLSAELKYEAPVHPSAVSSFDAPSADQLFPHLYGPLNMDAVVNVLDLPVSPGGQFIFPAL